jgi:hypothetical protein
LHTCEQQSPVVVQAAPSGRQAVGWQVPPLQLPLQHCAPIWQRAGSGRHPPPQ